MGGQVVSNGDDLVAALIKGDPNETVPLDIVTAMAESALRRHWIQCQHENLATQFDLATGSYQRYCQRCGARLIVEPEDTDG